MTSVLDVPQQAKFHDVIAEIERQLKEDYAPSRMKRDAHPKMHGCVLADFIVDRDLPDTLRRGVFQVPEHQYRAWVRFSNAFKIQHDLEFETRGLAIKLIDILGESLEKDPVDADLHEGSLTFSQDFLLATHDAFFLPDPQDYLAFVKATRTSARGVFQFYMSRLRHRWAWRGLRALLASQIRFVSNPLTVTYFSQTPYDCGETKIKLQVRPAERELRARFFGRLRFAFKVIVANTIFIFSDALYQRGKQAAEEVCNKYLAPRDMLRHAMMASLASRDVWFDVLAQPFVDDRKTPIDDATRRWKESASGFKRVAKIRIPRQVFWPEAGMPKAVEDATNTMVELGENMAFNPWHGLVAHRPLGPINEIRREVYRAISSFRRDQNSRGPHNVLAKTTIRRQVDEYEGLRRIVQEGEVQLS